MGGIGAGKTTAAERVAEHLGFHPVFESYQENYFLPLFYKNKEQWAFCSQTFFLVGKANQMAELHTMLAEKPIVLDVAMYQDLCYVEAQKTLGLMPEKDYQLYQALFQKIEQHVPVPDMLIYLKASLPELRKRIQRRGRDMERAIDEGYLSALVHAQDEWVQKNKKKFHIHTLTTDSCNFADEEQAVQVLVETVQNELKKEGS